MEKHPEEVRLRRYASVRKRVRKGNRPTLLSDGDETFPAMKAAIAAAKRFIHVEFYIWRGDQTGWDFADALIERARAGVEVRAMYDALGSIDVDPLIFDTMRSEGIEVLQYRPLAPWRPRWGVLRRNHRKALVVDNEVAFVGGLNLADDYAGTASGGKGWRDTMVELRGPIVNDVNRLFLHTWERETKDRVKRAPAPKSVEQPGALAALLANSEFGQRTLIRKAYLRAIQHAAHTIFVANPYFLPQARVRRALYRAARRGVDVRLIVPDKNDVPIVGWAMEHLFTRFLKRGIRVFRWSGAMIHAKIAAIDSAWSTVGSYNLDHRSLRSNLELNVMVLDRTFGLAMDEQFLRDFERCRELDLEKWSRRSWFERLRSWLWYQARLLL